MFDTEIELLKLAYERALGTGYILYIFLVFAVYVTFFYNKKDNRIRIVFGLYSIMLFLLFINPIFTRIFVKIMGQSVYYRVYWILPIIFVVAFGFTELIFKLFSTRSQKAFGILVSILIVILCGGFAYHGANYQKVANYYKVPDQILEVIFYVMEDNEDYKCLAGPYEFQVYTRQVDGTILVSDGRSMSGYYGDGSVVTQINYGNSEKISEICYKNNYNYLVIPNEINLTTDLEELGFDKMMANDVYTLYKANSEKMEELYK